MDKATGPSELEESLVRWIDRIWDAGLIERTWTPNQDARYRWRTRTAPRPDQTPIIDGDKILDDLMKCREQYADDIDENEVSTRTGDLVWLQKQAIDKLIKKLENA